MVEEIQHTSIEEDIKEIKGWQARHESAHTADTKLLATIVDTLSEHQNNHHSRTSVVKQNSIVGVVLTAIYAIAEILRQFAF